MGPKGTIPSMMAFGTLPIFLVGRTNQKDREESTGVMKAVRAGTDIITAELRSKETLRAKIPPATR